MPDLVTYVYLVLMFIALYMFAFFLILNVKNKDKLFSYKELKRKPLVSVLIPAYNEEDSIEDTVKHVMDLDYENFEVLILNDGSKDATGEIAKKLIGKYDNLKLIDKENSGKARSLNIGVEQANGELVAVVDSDSFPSKSSLSKLVGFFEDPKMGAVTSFVRVRNDEHNYLAKLQAMEYLIMGWTRKLLDFVGSVYVTNGPLSLYRKEYIKKVGGFDYTTVTEDIDITWNMLSQGYKTGMCLGADVTTVVPHRFSPWFKQRTRWGLGGLQALFKYRNLFFRKGMFGIFVLPFVSFSIIVSLATFIFSSYLVLNAIYLRSLSVGYSVVAQATIFRFQDLNLSPSVMLFYFVVLFILSIVWTWYILSRSGFLGQKGGMSIKRFFNMLFYMILYLTLYPIVWFASIYRYIKKDMRW